ncbi:MAG: hypothetical protein QNJ97_01535 [Myxococcota bacterium]|nr:hypothetical protein [Myxococcota bacterium]
MGRFVIAIVVSTVIIVVFSDCATASGQGMRHISKRGDFSFQVESQGRALPTYTHRGRTYVEGRWGETYDIRVVNHTGRRVEAVVTVDGRNVVTGEIGDYRTQRGYVIPAYGSVLIDGFRKSWDQVAAFRFTDVPDAYAARMGDATDVGVIGVAVFKERRRPVTPHPKRIPNVQTPRAEEDRIGEGSGAEQRRSMKRRRSMPSAQSAPTLYDDAASDGVGQGLGTAYGTERFSPAEQTHFTRRRHRVADALLAIHYDDREGLIARGVVPRRIPNPGRYRNGPNPFPHAPMPGFAPPPPQTGRHTQ